MYFSLFIYSFSLFFFMLRRPPITTRTDTLFPYTTLFLSPFLARAVLGGAIGRHLGQNRLPLRNAVGIAAENLARLDQMGEHFAADHHVHRRIDYERHRRAPVECVVRSQPPCVGRQRLGTARPRLGGNAGHETLLSVTIHHRSEN